MMSHVGHEAHCVGFVGAALDDKIAVSLYVAFRVEHDYRNGVVAVDDFQHQIDVGVLVGAVKRTHSLRPHLHLVMLLRSEVADEDM